MTNTPNNPKSIVHNDIDHNNDAAIETSIDALDNALDNALDEVTHPKCTDTPRLNRRQFLAGSSGAAALTTMPWLMNLPQVAHAAEGDDYKALVCVFLAGGNDHNNTVIPFDANNYTRYKAIRGDDIAIAQTDILPLAPKTTLPYGQKLGLNKTMTGLQGLFGQGKVSILLNVGTLLEPTNLASFKSKSVALPPRLFSHNDQQAIWRSAKTEGSTKGYGGRMADTSVNANAQPVFSCISVSGKSVYLEGDATMQYTTNPRGAIKILGANGTRRSYGGTELSQALRKLYTQTSTHSLEKIYTSTLSRSINAEETLTSALSAQTPLATTFGDGRLNKQLNMVAKIIQARKNLGMKRQVFYVMLPGFDSHDELRGEHDNLLKELSNAMTNFYNATVEMGLANNVTTFTASDFGRTLVGNGNGSDHGWGGHHFIVGGAVKGQDFYGKAPEIELETTTDAGKGRLIPTTSVDQYIATLASWFGVPDNKLSQVAPNIDKFTPKTMGFL